MAWSTFKMVSQVGQQVEANKKLAAVQSQINDATKQVNDLKLQVERLNDKEYIGQKAQKDLGMLNQGEKQIIPVR